MAEPSPLGRSTWMDLTIPDAESVRTFYEAVVGWSSQPADMGGYSDYSMIPPGGEDAVAGICHARGENAGLPPQWLVYVYVANLEASLRECEARGGGIVHGPRDLGAYGKLCVIRDPAGAVMALMEAPAV